jgi:hypothetical protein
VRKRTKWGWLGLGVGTAATLLAGLLLFLRPTKDVSLTYPPDVEWPLPTTLPALTLSLGPEAPERDFFIPCPGTRTGGFLCQFLSGPNADLWVLVAANGTVQYAHRGPDGWRPLAPLASRASGTNERPMGASQEEAQGGTHGPIRGAPDISGQPAPKIATTSRPARRVIVTNLKAVMDGAGRPVVVWMQSEAETQVSSVLASRWTGQDWSPVETLDRFRSANPSLDVVSDDHGRIHVVYTRELDPPESYRVGWLDRDRTCTDKPFHVVCKGGVHKPPMGAPPSAPIIGLWVPHDRPASTTPPGRFYVDGVGLCTGPGGAVHLTAAVHPFSRSGHGGTYLACQRWDGERWGDLTRLTPDCTADLRGGMVVDRWGTKHVWWSDARAPGRYVRIRDGRASPHQFLGYRRQTPLRVSAAGDRVFLVLDRDGRLAVWDGVRLSPPFRPQAFPFDDLVLAPDGRTFLARADADGLRLRELRVAP